jgi:hypothetical protein
VLVSGCLEGGPSTYTLSTRPVTGLPHERVDTPIGTSGTSMTYVLTPRDEVNLSRHVGRKVEIRGSLLPARSDPPPAQSSSQVGPSTGSGRQEGTPSRRSGRQGEPHVLDDNPGVKPKADDGSDTDAATLVRPNVAVTSVRVVSASCR